MYIIRLDDASDYMNTEFWGRIEVVLDKYDIKPIVGVIPNCEDKSMLDKYPKDNNFWEKVKRWKDKGWSIALHGYNHVYISNSGGINPVNKRSEFAGVDITTQREKIRYGIEKFKEHSIEPDIFYAPSHTFDDNTLLALKEESNIRIISDTIATDVYFEKDFYFIPQQTGKVRKLPFKVTTFCYHPNNMNEASICELEKFIIMNKDRVINIDNLEFKNRKKSLVDKFISFMYFSIRKLRTL
jgi:predicted deacetylase